MKIKTLRRAFLASVPVMAGYLVLGNAYGVLLADKGYSVLRGLSQSLLIFGPDRFLIPAMLAITAVLVAYSLKDTKKGGLTHDA